VGIPDATLPVDAKGHIDMFGREAIYTDGDGNVSVINVIVDDAHLETAVGGIDYSTTEVVATAYTPDVSTADTDATLEFDDVIYNVTDVRKDGTGANGSTDLVLSRD